MQKVHAASASGRVSSTPGEKNKGGAQPGVFVRMALDMSWRLAIVVLVPILVGVKLDKLFATGHFGTFVGLGMALIGTVLVLWRTMQTANRLPVPKLTAAQKRAIRKSYEAEDKE